MIRKHAFVYDSSRLLRIHPDLRRNRIRHDLEIEKVYESLPNVHMLRTSSMLLVSL
jgi:hypothetical protein